MIPLEEADNLDDKEPTPELQTAIMTLVRAGNYPETAAAVFGVSEKNLRRWLRSADEGIEPYLQFKLELEEAKQVMWEHRAEIIGRAITADEKSSAQ